MKQYTVYGSLIPRDDAPDERDAVYLASEVDARIAELESLLRRSWLKPASSEPGLEAEVMKALGL